MVSWAGVSGSPVAWGTGGLTLIAVSAATAIGGGLNHVLWLVSLEDLLAGSSWSAHWDWLCAGSWKGGVAWDHLDSWGVATEAGGASDIWVPDWVLPHGDDSWLGLLNNNLLWLNAGVEAGTALSIGVTVALSVLVSATSVSVSVSAGALSVRLTSLAWSLSELSISPLLTLGEVVSSEGSEESVVAVLPSGVSSSDLWLWLVALSLVSACLSAAKSAISATGLAVLALSGESAGLSVSEASAISASTDEVV